MPRVNPEILRWARETAGLDTAEAARKIGLREARGVAPVDRLVALEAGETSPSRPLLLKMAKSYRRPLLTFYLSRPPRRGDRGQDFRTLPERHSDAAEALLDALIRDVQARQSLVRAALEDEDETTPLPFIGSLAPSAGVPALVRSIREVLGFDLTEFRAARTSSDAFKYLRSSTEAAGIFVLLIGDLGSHHSAIALETFRGFALADHIAPFVIVNDRDSRSAWSFTLLHELTHLWLGQTGISGQKPARDIEKFCNDVASEILLPPNELSEIPKARQASELVERIGNFAKERNVSSSMVAYKLYRHRLISRDAWRELRSRFRDLWTAQKERDRERSGAPSYYVVRRHRMGQGLIQLVGRMLSAGELTTVKAGRILGVEATQVQSMLGNPAN